MKKKNSKRAVSLNTEACFVLSKNSVFGFVQRDVGLAGGLA